MKKSVGIICLAACGFLLLKAHDLGSSFGWELQQLLAGRPVDEAMGYYVLGGALGIFGLFLTFWKIN
jgi:hypothetical protein